MRLPNSAHTSRPRRPRANHSTVRRVSVTDPIAVARRYDYADAFELRLEGPDRCSPEEWVRAGVDATPAWIKRIAGHADGLGSARIVQSDAHAVVLEASDPLVDTVMVGRSAEPERRVLTTVLRYRRPLLARAVWGFVRTLHRRTAQQVVAGGLWQGDRSDDATRASTGARVAPVGRQAADGEQRQRREHEETGAQSGGLGDRACQ